MNPLITTVQLGFAGPRENSEAFSAYRMFCPEGTSFVRGPTPGTYVWIFRAVVAEQLRARDPLLFTNENTVVMGVEEFKRQRKSLSVRSAGRCRDEAAGPFE